MVKATDEVETVSLWVRLGRRRRLSNRISASAHSKICKNKSLLECRGIHPEYIPLSDHDLPIFFVEDAFGGPTEAVRARYRTGALNLALAASKAPRDYQPAV